MHVTIKAEIDNRLSEEDYLELVERLMELGFTDIQVEESDGNKD